MYCSLLWKRKAREWRGTNKRDLHFKSGEKHAQTRSLPRCTVCTNFCSPLFSLLTRFVSLPKTTNTQVQTGCEHLFSHYARPRSFTQLHRSCKQLCCSCLIVEITSSWLSIPLSNSTLPYVLPSTALSTAPLSHNPNCPLLTDGRPCFLHRHPFLFILPLPLSPFSTRPLSSLPCPESPFLVFERTRGSSTQTAGLW